MAYRTSIGYIVLSVLYLLVSIVVLVEIIKLLPCTMYVPADVVGSL